MQGKVNGVVDAWAGNGLTTNADVTVTVTVTSNAASHDLRRARLRRIRPRRSSRRAANAVPMVFPISTDRPRTVLTPLAHILPSKSTYGPRFVHTDVAEAIFG